MNTLSKRLNRSAIEIRQLLLDAPTILQTELGRAQATQMADEFSEIGAVVEIQLRD